MPDFPVALTNAIDNNTDIVASIINNIEEKIGIDGSADTNSLDYKVNYNNAKSHGIMGDGATDDTVAIQAFLDLSGDLYFPAGTYLFSDNLDYQSNSYIHGAGRNVTIFKLKAGSTPSRSTGLIEPGADATPPIGYRKENVTFAHFSIDGNLANVTTNPPDNNLPVYDGITVAATLNGLIYDVEVYDCTEVGFNTNDSYSDDFLTFGPVIVIGCFAHGCTYDGFQSANTSIFDSFANDNGSGGFHFVSAHVTGLTDRNLISGCTSIRNDNGFLFDTQGSANACPNFITNCAASRSYSGGIITQLQNTVISDCMVDLNNLYGIGIQADNSNVHDNIVKNSIGPGIYFPSDGRNNCHVHHNRCYDDQAIKTQTYGIGLGAGGYANVNYNSIVDNDFVGNLTAGIDPAIDEDPFTKLQFDIRNNYEVAI